MASLDRSQARAGAEVCQDDTTPGFLRAADLDQFFHEICKRQAVEAIAPDPGSLEPPGDRHDLGDTGHVVMKGGVEARDLGQAGITVSERLDQLDLARQVVRVIGADLTQFLDQLRRDAFGLMVAIPPVNDTMPTAPISGNSTARSSQSTSRRTAAFWSGASTRRSSLLPPPAWATTHRASSSPIRSTRPDRRRTADRPDQGGELEA